MRGAKRDVAAAAQRVHQGEVGVSLFHRAARGPGGFVGEIGDFIEMDVGGIAAEHGEWLGPARFAEGKDVDPLRIFARFADTLLSRRD